MPYAGFDVELRLDPRIQEIPEKHRAAAVALYTWAILYSAELLTDGHVSRTVMNGLAHELGQKRASKTLVSLTESGLIENTNRGFYITDWADFHSSRQKVEEGRKSAAERKRRSRGQLQMQLPSQRDVTDASQGDEGRDSRARAPARAPSPTPTQTPPAAEEQDQKLYEPAEPAAAASETEPPRETRIRQVVEAMPGCNRGSVDQVTSIAQQLPANVFEHIRDQTLARRNVTNRVGLFVTLLAGELEQRRRNTALANANGAADDPMTPAEASLRLHVPALAHLDDDDAYAQIDKLLDARNVNDHDRVWLTDLAADILRETRAHSTTAETGATL